MKSQALSTQQNSKRSQIDIIGMVLIVFILIIGGLLLLSMKLAKEYNDVSSTLVDPLLSQNFLDTLMETKTMQNKEVKIIINDCYDTYKNSICQAGSISDCCEYVQLVIGNALEKTFGEWGRKYRMTITREPTDVLLNMQFTNDPNCNENTEKEQPGFYYIADSPKPIEVVFYLCK